MWIYKIILAREFKLWPFIIRNNSLRNQATSLNLDPKIQSLELWIWNESSQNIFLSAVSKSAFLHFFVCFTNQFYNNCATRQTPAQLHRSTKKDKSFKMLRFCWIILLIGNISLASPGDVSFLKNIQNLHQIHLFW